MNQHAYAPDASLLEREELDIGTDDIVLLRAVEVSRLLGLSRSQVYQMMADGRLPVIRIGRAIRVPKRALSEWIRANTTSPLDAKAGASHEATLEP
jgi:excisionase family DNA binding protein